jgi:hypothetical protein
MGLSTACTYKNLLFKFFIAYLRRVGTNYRILHIIMTTERIRPISVTARTLGSWFRIPLESWMSVCVYAVFV